MPLELYIAFVATTALLIVTPGPVVTMVVANSIAHGGRLALLSVAGASSATVVHLAVVGLGMTSVLAVLSEWFEWLRWAGVAYLVYLGIRQWRLRPVAGGGSDEAEGAGGGTLAVSAKRLFWQGFLVNLTNPKSLLFYAAFFPQFLDPAAAIVPQLGILSVTFLIVAACIDSSYALVGGRLGGALRGEARARLRNRISGVLLVGAGLGLALIRRN